MQKASQITVDGHYGEQSHSALMGLAADLHPDTDQPEEEPRLLRVTGGRVNVQRSTARSAGFPEKALLLWNDASTVNPDTGEAARCLLHGRSDTRMKNGCVPVDCRIIMRFFAKRGSHIGQNDVQ